MCKKWPYYVRLVCALFCISCTLFLNTLYVKANTSFFSLFDSTVIIDTSAIPTTLTIDIAPTVMFTDYNGGSYSGSSSGTNSATTGSYSGANGSASGSYSGTVGQHSVSIPQISINGGSQSFRESGSMTSSSYTGTGILTLSGLKTYSASATESSASESGSISVNGSSESGSLSVDASTISTSDTGTISLNTTHGGLCNMHIEIPYNFDIPFAQNGDIVPNEYYAWFPTFAALHYNTSQITSLRNFAILDENKELITTKNSGSNRAAQFKLGSEFLGNNDNYALFNGYISFDISVSDITVVQTSTITFDFYPRLRHVASNMQSYVGNISSDPITHKLQSDSNTKLDTQITQENTAQTTRTGILNKITEFFGSFFTNLIGVFVPEDGYFTTWFNNLNSLLEAKLGILYYPFSKIIYFLNQLTTVLDGNWSSKVVFPAIEFTNIATGETYTFLAQREVYLDNYNISIPSSPNSSLIGTSDYSDLIHIVRTLNGFILVMSLLGLLRQKLNLILRGDDSDS